MTNSYCKKCGQCCKSIKVNFEKNILYFNGIQELDESFKLMLIPIAQEDEVYICVCKYLEENLCTNPRKPLNCIKYPNHPFAFIPDDCGYIGVIFSSAEKIKQSVRRMKEEIIHYNMLIESGISKTEENQYKKIIASHQKFIDKYSLYNSKDW